MPWCHPHLSEEQVNEYARWPNGLPPGMRPTYLRTSDLRMQKVTFRETKGLIFSYGKRYEEADDSTNLFMFPKLTKWEFDNALTSAFDKIERFLKAPKPKSAYDIQWKIYEPCAPVSHLDYEPGQHELTSAGLDSVHDGGEAIQRHRKK